MLTYNLSKGEDLNEFINKEDNDKHNNMLIYYVIYARLKGVLKDERWYH